MKKLAGAAGCRHSCSAVVGSTPRRFVAGRRPVYPDCQPLTSLCQASEIPLAYLEGEPFIGFQEDIPFANASKEVAAETGFNLDVVVELESIEAIKELVRQGAGFSFLPSSSLLGENIRRELSCIRICGNPIVREIIEVHKASDPVSRHIVLLRETIQQSLARGMKSQSPY